MDLDVFYTLADGKNTAWEFSFEPPDHTVKVRRDERIFVDGVQFEVTDPPLAKNRRWSEDRR